MTLTTIAISAPLLVSAPESYSHRAEVNAEEWHPIAQLGLMMSRLYREAMNQGSSSIYLY